MLILVLTMLITLASCQREPAPNLHNDGIDMDQADIIQGLTTAQQLCYDNDDAQACRVIIAAHGARR